MSDTRKTVWILGAGFSRSLGGPLLTDLLSPSAQAAVGTMYGGNTLLNSEEAQFVRGLVDMHHHHQRQSPAVWRDAEELLDQLDAEAHAKVPGRVARISGLLGLDLPRAGDFAKIRDAARRLVAAECCAFLESVNTEEERWVPYLSWARMVKAPDVILTFNYDRVLETLARFVIVPPSGEYDNEGLAAVFKLHGSVDWRRQEGPERARTVERGSTRRPTRPSPYRALTSRSGSRHRARRSAHRRRSSALSGRAR
jgi:hypothetical protein